MGLKTIAYSVLLVIVYLGHIALTLGNNDVIIEFEAAERRVHELMLSWNISDEYDVKHVVITHQKEGSQAFTLSGPLVGVEGYFVEDLNANTKYNVCMAIVMGDMDDDVCKQSEDACNTCVPMSTIKLIRADSLIAVIATLGFIVLLILIGYLCWYCAKKKATKQAEDSDDEEEEDKKPILLRVPPPTTNGPRKSVEFEDEDIPWIDEPIRDSTSTRI